MAKAPVPPLFVREEREYRQIHGGRLLHREVAHPERVGRGGSKEQPVVIEAGHRILLQAEGKVAANGRFRSSWRSYKDGVVMRWYVDRHADVIGRARRVVEGCGGCIAASIPPLDGTRAIEPHDFCKAGAAALRPLPNFHQ